LKTFDGDKVEEIITKKSSKKTKGKKKDLARDKTVDKKKKAGKTPDRARK